MDFIQLPHGLTIRVSSIDAILNSNGVAFVVAGGMRFDTFKPFDRFIEFMQNIGAVESIHELSGSEPSQAFSSMPTMEEVIKDG